MEFISMFFYILIILIIMGLLGFGAYIYYDYIEHKKKLESDLAASSQDLNYNFKESQKDLTNLFKTTSDTKEYLFSYSNIVKNLDTYTSNTSNVLVNRIVSTSNVFNNTFDSFDRNLNRFFIFKDGENDISAHTGANNKIFNYIFEGNATNMELISQTTAIGGITINSDIDKELKICSSEDPTKCIKMDTDVAGNFTITPDGTNNIVFKNNNNNILANFDTSKNSIFFGGNNESTSTMYMKDNNVYVKNLSIMSPNKNISNLYNFDYEKYKPLYTKCTINNTSTVTTVTHIVRFDNQRDLTTLKTIFVDNPYIDLQKFQNIAFEIYKDSTTTVPYILLSLKQNSVELKDLKDSKYTYDLLPIESAKKMQNIKIQINSLTILPDLCELTIKFVANMNFTTYLPNNEFTFITNSYFME